MEVVDLNLEQSGGENNSSFDSGVELLMNQKSKSYKPARDVPMVDIDDLEKQLNDLSQPTHSKREESGSMFSWLPKFQAPTDNDTGFSSLGEETKKNVNPSSLDDSTFRVNTVPTASFNRSLQSEFVDERKLKQKKRVMLRKLETLHNIGRIKTPIQVNMDSSIEEVEDEYNYHIEDRKKIECIKAQGGFLRGAATFLEMGNEMFDPFGLRLDGLSAQVEDEIESYEDIFGELYDKYKNAQVYPELHLLLKLSFTVVTVNIGNQVMKGGGNAMLDSMQNLLNSQSAGAAPNNPNQFSHLSKAVLGSDITPASNGTLPPPIETKKMIPPPRPGMMFDSRPDLKEALQEKGVELKKQSFVNEPQERSSVRPDMKGPPAHFFHTDNDSFISIDEAREIQNSRVPKTTNRPSVVNKRKSEKNTISLDL
jgi:hypothetical protein